MRKNTVTYSNIAWDPKTRGLFGLVTFHTPKGQIHVECALDGYIPSANNPPRKALLEIAKTKISLPSSKITQSTYQALITRAA